MLGGANDSRAGYESARLELARLRLGGGDARAVAMRQVAQTTARALGVERVGIWAFKGAGGGLMGVCQFDLRSDSFPPTGLPDELPMPLLLAEISKRRVVAIAEARTDLRTSELRQGYLEVNGIEYRVRTIPVDPGLPSRTVRGDLQHLPTIIGEFQFSCPQIASPCQPGFSLRMTSELASIPKA